MTIVDVWPVTTDHHWNITTEHEVNDCCMRSPAASGNSLTNSLSQSQLSHSVDSAPSDAKHRCFNDDRLERSVVKVWLSSFYVASVSFMAPKDGIMRGSCSFLFLMVFLSLHLHIFFWVNLSCFLTARYWFATRPDLGKIVPKLREVIKIQSW